MVQDASSFGVGRVVQLESTIEAVAVNQIGADPSAHRIGSFQNRDLNTPAAEMPRGGKTAQSGSHNDDGHAGHGRAPEEGSGDPSPPLGSN